MSEPFDEDPALAMAGESALIDAPAPTDRPEALLALYRRYRPETFAEVIGQEHVTEPLQRALTNNRVNHAYLFSGPRGCGKTTSARILARALNCAQGPTPVPCGECDSCRALARGGSGSIDVIEIDAASHGGVDDARDLRERAFFAPVHSRYKIYIVDEAHMVTTAGFNAMLKVVEEPPPHVKFIFATTEPEKVIGTIRSRTHHYPFRLVPPKVLGTYLAEVGESEGVDVERSVLPLVVRAGGGSVRDSLSVLDQLLGGAGDQGVTYAQASALLGFTPDSLLDEIVDAFAAGDGAGVFATIDKVIEVGQDPRRFAEDLLRRFRDLVIVTQVPDAISSGLVDVAADQAERLVSQGAGLGAGELTRAAEVLAKGITEMRGTTAPRLHLELMCSRILLPIADLDGRGLHARIDRLERRVGVAGPDDAEPAPMARPERRSDPATGGVAASDAAPGPTPEVPASHGAATQGPRQGPEAQDPATLGAKRQGVTTPGTGGPAEQLAPRSAGESGRPAASGTAGPQDDRPAAPTRDESGAPPAPARESAGHADPQTAVPEPASRPVDPAATPPSPVAPPEAPAARAGLGTADLRRLWPEVLEEIKRRRRFTWILLSQNAQVVDVADGVLTLALANPGARETFSRGGSEDILSDALVEVVGANLRISTIVDGAAAAPRGRGGQQRPASRPEPVLDQRGSAGAPPVESASVGTAQAGQPSGTSQPADPGTGGVSSAQPESEGTGAARAGAVPSRAEGAGAPATGAPTAGEPDSQGGRLRAAAADLPRYHEDPPPDPWDDPAPPDDRFGPPGDAAPASPPAVRPPQGPGGTSAAPPGPSAAPPAAPSPAVGRSVADAKEQIRPTRHLRAVPDQGADDFDESEADGAVVIDDASSSSQAELLKEYLGAELIGEDDSEGPRPI